MTDFFAARQVLCQEWGFAYVGQAYEAMQAAQEDVSKLPGTPALTFTDKASYLAARAAWRARQKAIEAQIRAIKAQMRTGETQSARSRAQSEAQVWAELATAALVERTLQKQKADREWSAERQAVAA